MHASTTIISDGAPSFATIRHFRAAGTQRQIGRALAGAAAAAHGRNAAPPRAADPVVGRARRRWIEQNHPVLHQRMLGVADHYGIDPADTSVCLDAMSTFATAPGCSVAFYPGDTTKDGHGLLSRNFDFPTASFTQIVGLRPFGGERPLAADQWVVELHPEDGYASVAVSIMDVMGAMDGINEAGLAVALLADNETPEPEPAGEPQVGLAEHQVVRYLLDTCATASEAKEALLMAKHYYAFTPCHYVVSDRTGASFVWEHSPRRNREVIVERPPSGPGPLVCTNHLLHRWPDPTVLPADEGPIGTAALTYQRWRQLSAANRSGALVDRETIREQFAAVRFVAPITEARTFWHALYDVDDASAEIAFYLRDEGGQSRYSAPLRVALS